MSQIQEGDQERQTEVARSSEDIQKRMKEIRERMALNDVYIRVGAYDRRPREYELLNTQLNELRWFLGEDVSTKDGVK